MPQIDRERQRARHRRRARRCSTPVASSTSTSCTVRSAAGVPTHRVRAAVYSHHHVDHVFGTKRFEEEATEKGWPQPVVYAHEDLPSHFDRYAHTLGWNTAINKRQFGLPVDGFHWPEHYRYPDVTYKDRLTFTRGRPHVRPAPRPRRDRRRDVDVGARAQDPPPRRPVHLGRAERRQPAEGAALRLATGPPSLRQMAGLDAEILLAGHGLPIFGADRVARPRSPTPPSCSSHSRRRRSR